MLPSVTTNLLRPLALADAIRLIGNAGFRAVEIEKAHIKRILASDDVARECERVRAAGQESGVRLVQLHATFGISAHRPLAETVRLAQDTLRASGQLGVEWVVIHPASGDRVYEDWKTYAALKDLNLKALAEMAAIAEDCRVGIAVENLPYLGVPRFGVCVPELAEMVDGFSSDVVGICWDTGHAHLAGLDQVQSLHAIGPRLKALHVQDTDMVCDRHWLPMRGEIIWWPIMQVLHDIRYEGAFNLELHGEENTTPLALCESLLRFIKECADYMLSPKFLEDRFEQRFWTTSGAWSRSR